VSDNLVAQGIGMKRFYTVGTLAALAAFLLILSISTGFLRLGIPGQYTWRYLPLNDVPAMAVVLMLSVVVGVLLLPRLLGCRRWVFGAAVLVVAVSLNLSAFLMHYDKNITDDLPRQLRAYAANAIDNSYLHDAWHIESLPAFLWQYDELMPHLAPPHNRQQPPLKITITWFLLKLCGNNPLPIPLLVILLNTVFPLAIGWLTRNRVAALVTLFLPNAVFFAVTFDLTLAIITALLLYATDRHSWGGVMTALFLIQWLSFAFFPILIAWILYSLVTKVPRRIMLNVLLWLFLINLLLVSAGLNYIGMFRTALSYLAADISSEFSIDYLSSLLYLPGEYLLFSFLPFLCLLPSVKLDVRRLLVPTLLAAALLLSGATRFEQVRTWLFITPFIFAACRSIRPPLWTLTVALTLAGLQVVLFKFALTFYCY